MKKQILIVGSGFSGMWAAVSAARLSALAGNNSLSIAVLAPVAELRVRPRFYEENVSTMVAPLTELFAELGIAFIAGEAQRIDTSSKTVLYRDSNGAIADVAWERLILSTGSQTKRPPVAGLANTPLISTNSTPPACSSSILIRWFRAPPPRSVIPWSCVAAALPASNWQRNSLPDSVLASALIQRLK